MNNSFIESPSASPSGSCCGRAKVGSDLDVHELIPLRSFLGDKWKTGMQQRCMICDKCTAWVCRQCSTGANALVPLCPEYTVPRTGDAKGTKVFHACSAKHNLNPNFFPKGITDNSKRRCKRARAHAASGDASEAEDAEE